MMTDFLMIAALVLIAAFFWQLRQMAEIARRYMERECARQRVQLVAIAMDAARPTLGGATGLGWRAGFMFEFSTDGINQFRGKLRMRGNQIEKIEWPIFPEPEWQQAPSSKGKFGGGCGSSCGSGRCH
ncbi:hypothetical protein HR45_12345 [Shewanella mangrovi]|uniref:DUF3301 domain-containing protein n=1 Tax=Shewanella mangrovi TaxID=1515746 RepID=A0A094JB98_9GAMM|nr:DUF3301 domain-containing protein [Shewanella mangrovi]KFZ37195.1 hypothetical protein HR45_12345 [Shewanella mangrovi]